MGVGDNSKISDYIDYVCSYVKFKAAHKLYFNSAV